MICLTYRAQGSISPNATAKKQNQNHDNCNNQTTKLQKHGCNDITASRNIDITWLFNAQERLARSIWSYFSELNEIFSVAKVQRQENSLNCKTNRFACLAANKLQSVLMHSRKKERKTHDNCNNNQIRVLQKHSSNYTIPPSDALDLSLLFPAASHRVRPSCNKNSTLRSIILHVKKRCRRSWNSPVKRFSPLRWSD